MGMVSEPGSRWETSSGDSDGSTEKSYNQYELLAWVKASEHRKDILTTLDTGPENTTHFKEKWDVATADVPRRYIKELQSRDLVECLTPDRQRYRLYGLTDEGRELAGGL